MYIITIITTCNTAVNDAASEILVCVCVWRGETDVAGKSCGSQELFLTAVMRGEI